MSEKWWKSQFVLSTFASVHTGDNVEAVIGLLHEAGLNTLESNTPLEYSAQDLTHEEQVRVLKVCEKYGMKYFVTDHRRLTGIAQPSEEDLKSLVSDYQGYTSLGGYYVWDEPHWEHFPDVKDTFATLRSLDPDRLPLVPLVPSYGPYHYPEAYPNFVKDFAETVEPDVLSFDFYGVRVQGVEPSLYRDLALWAKVSRETGRPLWFYPSSCMWGPIAKPTEATIRFQVFTAIAYGAKGIQYFMARDFVGGDIDFTGAPIRADGTKSETFDAFAAVNHDVEKISSLLMRLKMENVFHTAPVPETSIPLEKGYQSLIDASENLVLAFHKDEDSVYLIVVSKDLSDEREICLSFDKPVQLHDILSGEEFTPGKARDARLKMNPGQGRVLWIE